MKHLKLFEAYGRSEFMRTEFSRENGNKYNADLENFPKEIDQNNSGVSPEDSAELDALGLLDKIQIEDNYVESVVIEYDINVYKDRGGISDLDFTMKSVRITGTYEVWNAEKDDTDSFDFEIEDAGPFDGRVEFETGGFPIYPQNITIKMNNSFDSKNFTYYVELGTN